MGFPSWVSAGTSRFGFSCSSVFPKKDLILWPSASRKVLGFLSMVEMERKHCMYVRI